MNLIRSVIFIGLLHLAGASLAFGQAAGSVVGQVQDTLGAVVVGATVTAVAANGTEKTAVTNSRNTTSFFRC